MVVVFVQLPAAGHVLFVLLGVCQLVQIAADDRLGLILFGDDDCLEAVIPVAT